MKRKLLVLALWRDASDYTLRFIPCLLRVALPVLLVMSTIQTAFSTHANSNYPETITFPGNAVAPTLTLETTGPATAACGDIITVDITNVSGFIDIGSLQHSVNWDETQLEYQSHVATQIGGVGGDPLVGTGNTAGGELTYSWIDPDGIDGEDLPDGTVLMTITFKVITSGGTASVDITGTPLAIEVADNTLAIGTVIPQNNADIALGPVVVTLVLVDDEACPNETMLTLDGGTPPGGTYSGTAVTGTNFDPSVAGPGIHTITYTYTDMDGCTNSATDDITVQDVIPPVINCPVTMQAGTADANCEYIFSGTTLDATATDNCLLSTVLNDFTNSTTLDGAVFPLGITVVTWTATDAVGLTSTCTVEVTVTDITPPTITCPAPDTVFADIDCDYDVLATEFDVTLADVADNCSIASITNDLNGLSSLAGYAFLQDSTTVVTWTVTDGSGLTASCTAIVTVIDTTPPVLSYTFPTAYAADVTSGDCSTVVNIERPNIASVCPFPIPGFDNFTITGCDIAYIQPTEGPAIVNGVPDPNFLNVVAPVDVCNPGTKFAAIQFPVGVTEIPYVWCDSLGNCDTVVITITITENGLPTANCLPGIITLPLDATGTAVVTVDLVNDNSADNCGIDSSWVFPDTLTCADAGNNLVVLTVSDDENNTDTCHATVNVVDNLPPVVNCPTDFIASTDTNTCTALASNIPGLVLTEIPSDSSINAPGQYKDNCGVTNITYTLSGVTTGSGTYPIPGSQVFNIGATFVTYTFFDAAGNSVACSFVVTVQDLVPPTAGITCPNPPPVNANTGGCIAVVTWTPPTFTDNCPGTIIVTSSHNPGAFFFFDTTLVTYTAIDAAGNVGVCTFNVVVNDVQPPVAQCKDITVLLDANGVVTVNPAQLDNGSTDNCFYNYINLPDTFNCTNAGANDYTLVIEDAGGNRDSATCTLTVSDITAPAIVNCNAFVATDINLDAACFATLDAATYSLNFTITDNTLNSMPSCPLTFEVDVDGSGFAPTYQFTCADKGVNVVTFRVSDVFGNSAVCTKNITVNDVTPPAIIDANTVAPPAVTVECSDYDANDFATLGQITLADVTDACDDSCDMVINISFNDVTAPGSCANASVVTRTWTVTDMAGNATLHTQTISVVDTESPVITGVQPLVNLEANNQNETPQCAVTHTVELFPFNVGDNCTTDFADYTITYLIDFAPLGVGSNVNGTGAAATATFPIGASEVTFTVADPCGNTSQVTVTVMVDDVDGPVIDEPFGAFFGNTKTVCDSTFTILNATGNCGNNFSWYRPYSNANEENFLDCSNYSVTEVISDPTVQSAINASAPFVYNNPPLFSIFPTTFFPVGQTTITYTATDVDGNTTVCSFTVKIVDNQPPVIACPANQNLSITAGCTDSTFVPSYLNGIQITDNCPNSVVLTQSPAPGTNLSDIVNPVEAGQTFMVTVSATDSFPNNLSSVPCTFTVTLFDGVAPVPVLPFLPDIVFLCGVDTVDAPMALDCNGTDFDTIYGTPSVPVQDILPPLVPGGPPRYVLNVGNYAITWSYTDPQNNTTTQLQSVQIQLDVNPPIAICKPAFTVNLSAAGDYALTIPEIDNGSSDPDACGLLTLSLDPAVLTCNNLNVPADVVLTVEDAGGNTAQCTTAVTVLDITAPVLSPIPANDTLEACVPIPAPAHITAVDVCDTDVNIVFDQDTVTFVNAYTYTIRRTWTATDDSGNATTGTQIIVIEDTQAPVFTAAPDTIMVFTDLNNLDCKDTVTFDIAPFVNDCDSTTLTITNNRTAQGAAYSEILDLGVYNLVFTAEDGNDNVATHLIVLVVKDGTDPIAACINGVSVSLQTSGSVTVTSANIDANSSDNCTPQNLLDMQIQRLDPLGPITTDITFTCPDADGVTQHPVRLYVKDEAGNESTCETYIVVQDNVFPTITFCPPGNTLQCDADFSPAVQGIAIATDNCTVTSMTYSDSTAPGLGNFCYRVLRTWLAVDQADNATTCVQTFNVQDTVKPVLTLTPADVSINCGDALVTPPVVGATDNCVDSVAVVLVVDTIDVAQGDCGLFSYTIRRTWTAIDACDNTTVHTQEVTVLDTIAPVFTGMPDTITVNSADFPANLNCTVPVALDISQYLSDCEPDSMLTLTNNAPHGDGGADISGDYAAGDYTVLFTAIDACGNESADSIVVRVIDNSIPTVICNDDVVIALGANGSATLTPDAIDQNSTDNCGIDTMFLSQSVFDCGDLGINSITMTVVDSAGNFNTCTVDVNVTPGVNTGFTLTTTSTPESVSGANDGTATATATGGSGLFAYDWNNGDTTATITGLASGMYIVIVTDKQNGCQQTDTVIVEEGIKINLIAGNGEGCINQVISIQVTVNNFTDITDFNFTLNVPGDSVGTILGITAGSVDPALAAGLTSNLLPGNNLGVFWSDTALTLPNGTVLFNIDIQLGTAAVGSVSPVIIAGTPVSLLFLQLINGDEVAVDVDTLNGLIEITCGLPDLEIAGDIQTWNNPMPVPGVDVSLTGTVTANQTTGAPGTYLFGIPDSANTIVRCNKVTAGNAGITGADILLIKRHVLNIQPLTSPYQYVAADVSGEGNLSILDYARIQQVALALLDHITGSPDWKFVPKSYVFPVPPLSVPFPDSISHLPATMSFPDDDFVAVRMGDVNGNIVPSFTGTDDTDDRSGLFRFRLDDRSFEAGETIEVPFLASGFSGHSGYQMTIEFDRQVFELAGIEPGILPDMNDANFGAMRAQEGMLTTLWVTPEPMTVADGAVLFTLEFKVLRSGNTLSEVLRPGSELTRAEGYDSEGKTMNIDFEFAQNQNGATPATFVLYQNQPNPFSESTTVAFRLPETGPATLRIFNASGQLVKLISGNFDRGYHELRFRRDELGTPGVYYYELESRGSKDRKKMVLMD